MYHNFLGPRGLRGNRMDTLKPKNSKLITFTERGGFFTFWAILAHSGMYLYRLYISLLVIFSKPQIPGDQIPLNPSNDGSLTLKMIADCVDHWYNMYVV